MPRPRGSEFPDQRQFPRPPLHLRSTASADAKSIHRAAINRQSKINDLHKRKRGTKEADLEKKLSETLEGLKKIKEQLASAEASKRDAQKELEKTKKLVVFNPPVGEEENPLPVEEDRISSLTIFSLVSPATRDVGSSQLVENSLKESRAMAERLMVKLQAEEGDKASMEAEMKRLRVQTDQWRKAAEEAAAILASGVCPATAAELNGRRVDDRFRLTDKSMGDYEVGAVGGGIRRFGDFWKKKVQEK